MKTKVRRIRAWTLQTLLILAKRKRFRFIILHWRPITNAPPSLLLPLVCGHVKGKLTCPDDLCIVLIHDHPTPPLTQQSLEYVGIKTYTVLKPEWVGPWRHTTKLRQIYDFLHSDRCTQEYLLYCDSDDAIFRASPDIAIRQLSMNKCEMLFSNTRFQGGYQHMPVQHEWSKQLAQSVQHDRIYLNSGVFVAKTAFLARIIERALEFVTDDDLSVREVRRLLSSDYGGTADAEFPKSCGSDQTIFRFIHPEFFPHMQIDYDGVLAPR